MRLPRWQARVPGGITPTLSTWNHERERELAKIIHQSQYPEQYSNGLACDKCGGDLYDTNRQASGTPVRIIVKCKDCGFKGERYE
jgi:predicted RNA-binding Zn-ribbon protein involved in translation (DUF1610 family)